jgi:hypothetical protein
MEICIWKKVVVVAVKLLFQHVSAGTEEDHEKMSKLSATEITLTSPLRERSSFLWIAIFCRSYNSRTWGIQVKICPCA